MFQIKATQLRHLLVDDNENWKHVNIFIGGNDLCEVCNGDAIHFPTNYVTYIEHALEILSEIPRTFVSIVNVIDVTLLNQFAIGLCPFLHMVECPCIARNQPKITEQAIRYRRLMDEMVEQFSKTDDFTVVVQPFMDNVMFGEEPERELLSPDCFHFTTFTHSSAGIHLWNNLLESVGQKSDRWNITNPIICPTKNSFLKTRKNSMRLN